MSLASQANFDVNSRIELFSSSDRTRQVGITTFDKDLSEHGCKANGNYAIIVHGWRESISTPWVSDMIANLLLYRGGCVIFMDYSIFAIFPDYFRLTSHFVGITKVLLRKIKQVGNYDRLFMFGFSFGSRLCFEAGAQLGHQVIDRIDACDPAGPGFDGVWRTVDPKLAARHVACINTSIDKGTKIYNCHQNFRMGNCGVSQPAAGPRPLGNHGMCPYLYNSAFDFEFEPSYDTACKSDRAVQNIPDGLIMGYKNKIGS